MRSATIRTERYTRVAIAFHWVIAALIVFNLWLGLAHDSLPKDWQVMPVHKAVGVTVLVLTLGRIAWRLAHPAPPLPSDLKPWQRAAAYCIALRALRLHAGDAADRLGDGIGNKAAAAGVVRAVRHSLSTGVGGGQPVRARRSRRSGLGPDRAARRPRRRGAQAPFPVAGQCLGQDDAGRVRARTARVKIGGLLQPIGSPPIITVARLVSPLSRVVPGRLSAYPSLNLGRSELAPGGFFGRAGPD